MTITKEELERRHGVNVGFFYLREKTATHGERKCQVFVKGCQRFVWDGARWRSYTDFQPSESVERAIERCTEFNGAPR